MRKPGVTTRSRRRAAAVAPMRRRSGTRKPSTAERSWRRSGESRTAPLRRHVGRRPSTARLGSWRQRGAAGTPLRRRSATRAPSAAACHRRRRYRSAARSPVRRRSAQPRPNSVARRVRRRRTATMGRCRRQNSVRRTRAAARSRQRAGTMSAVPISAPKRVTRHEGGHTEERSAFVPTRLRRRGAVARGSTHAGNRRRCVAAAVGPLRRRGGTGEQTAVAGTRGWGFPWTAQRAPARGSTPTGATRRRHRGGEAAGVRLRRRSGWRTPPGMARWGRRSVRRQWSGTLPRCVPSVRRRAPGHGTSRRPCGARCGAATRVVAAMSTATAGGAAAPAIGWRSTTSCRSRSAAARNRQISGCVVKRTTGCATLSATATPRGEPTEARRAPVCAVDPNGVTVRVHDVILEGMEDTFRR